MKQGIYYDWAHTTYLTADDGCPFERWETESSKYAFAVHPKGYCVFLPPDELAQCDEYAESDPYAVQENLDSAFHRRRFNLTLELLDLAAPDHNHPYNILDIGCGEGFITREFFKAYPAAQVRGLDYAMSAIDHAVADSPGIDFVVADASSAPFPPETFDVVVCNNIWEHVPDPVRMLQQIHRITRPGGYLVLSTPSRYRLGNMARVLMGSPVRLVSPHHVTEYTIGQIHEQLRFGGYKVLDTRSRPIRTTFRLRHSAMQITKPFVQLALWLVRSHHNLEETIFFLARRNDENTKCRNCPPRTNAAE